MVTRQNSEFVPVFEVVQTNGTHIVIICLTEYDNLQLLKFCWTQSGPSPTLISSELFDHLENGQISVLAIIIIQRLTKEFDLLSSLKFGVKTK